MIGNKNMFAQKLFVSNIWWLSDEWNHVTEIKKSELIASTFSQFKDFKQQTLSHRPIFSAKDLDFQVRYIQRTIIRWTQL